MSSPRVSVIMPCYDDARFLGEAIESVQSQTFQDFEVLIVDDGSTDPATAQLLKRLDAPKTRVEHIEHGGVMRARNVGISLSTGPYLAFFDSDDRMHPEFLERTVAVLDSDPSVSFASCWVRLFGDENWEWKPEHCDFPWLLHECTVATVALVRRDAVREVGGFDETMKLGHEDWDLWQNLVARGHRGTILREPLFFYRRAGDSRSRVADRGATYLEIYRDLLEKRHDQAGGHLFELLWLKEQSVIGPHLAGFHELCADVDRAATGRVTELRAELLERIRQRRSFDGR